MDEGMVFVYTNGIGYRSLAYSHASGRDIPAYHYYEDNDGETMQLNALLNTVEKGDVLIVGSITDFMLPDCEAMTATLKYLNEVGVKVLSRLQTRYNFDDYIRSMELLEAIDKVKSGQKPV